MRRRTLLAATVALAAPVTVRAASTTTSRVVPASDLAALDPVWTTAPDDRTIRFRLKRPFPLLPNAGGKPSTMPCIMPERLARGAVALPTAFSTSLTTPRTGILQGYDVARRA